MRRLFARGSRVLLIAAAVVVAAGLSAGTAAHATAATVSSAPCSFDPVGTCQSTDGTVTENFQFLNASTCTFALRVAWDDGAVSNVTVTDPADGYLPFAHHTYTKAGTYTIVITGQVVTGDCTVTALSGDHFTFVQPTPAPSPAACAPVWFIGARGSGEPTGQSYGTGKNAISGMGKEVDYLAYQVRADLASRNVGVEFKPVGYPADSVNDLKPSATVLSLLKKPTGVAAALVTYVHQSVDKYDASMNQGIKQTETAVAEVLKSCPQAKLILGGYSQGAVAIHDAENALPTAELSHIAGTLLLADPDRVSNTKSKRFGDSLAKGEGLRVYLHLVRATDVPKPGTTATITTIDDLVGDFQGAPSVENYKAEAAIHSSYETTVTGRNLLGSAAKWVASKVPS
jgi:hypothetical protein